MTFYEVVRQVLDLLQRQGRVSYRALKREFGIDDDFIEDLKEELCFSHPVVDEDGRGLVWTGDVGSVSTSTFQPTPEPPFPPTPEPQREPLSYTPPHLAEKILTSRSALEGERKQVTVLFCDLANPTAIAEKIGAENMHGLLGTINQFLGDGIMALYGAPLSLEDHARRGAGNAVATLAHCEPKASERSVSS